MAILDHGLVTSQFFEQVNNLRGLLLSQQVHLQVEFESLLLKLGFPILSDEDNRRRYQHTQADYALQPEEWRRVQRLESKQLGQHISEQLKCNEG